MKYLRLIAIVAMAFILASCAKTNCPSVLSKGTPDQIRIEAMQLAKADFAAGKPRICIAGSIGTSPVGIPADKLKVIKNIPEWKLPCGCTDPLAKPAITFAEAYNTTILSKLSQEMK